VTTQTPLFDAVSEAWSRSHSPERWTDADRPTDWHVGRDPRRMAQRELRAMGHEPMSPMEAIRAKCLDCCAGSLHEVRCCVAMACPSWPFRMGKNPWRAPLLEERREALRQRSRFSSRLQKTKGENDRCIAGVE